MTRWLAIVALACCLLLAGCSGVDLPGGSSGGPAAADAGDGPPYPDPWPGSPTVVAINDTTTDERNLTVPVANAIAYWNENDDRYGTYTAEFVLRPDAEDPDVLVEFVGRIDECGHVTKEETVGCAPILSNRSLAERPTTVRIETGYTDESTELIVEHEFGHVLGLNHGDEPASLMTGYADRLDRLPMANVSERRYTWKKADLALYVDHESLPGSRETIDRQIGHAIAYYESGADGGVPDNITLTRIDDREAADVVITGGDIDGASTSRLNGVSPDADPALEYYTNQTIVVSRDTDPETLGWHVGFWLGDSLLAPDSWEELPEPFDDPDTDDRRDWW